MRRDSGQKIISKNELWDKFKGVRVIMEIRMKNISGYFQDWRESKQERTRDKFYMKFEADRS